MKRDFSDLILLAPHERLLEDAGAATDARTFQR
mgnify:CR=1 FL=1